MDGMGVPILECPRELIERERFRNYLQHRTYIGGKGYWTQYVDSAPSVVFPNHRLTTRQVKDTKLVFNWYMRAEHKQRGSAEERCQLCDKTMGGDTERHLYTECTHVSIDNPRREMVEDLRNIMESVSHDTPNQKNVISSLFNLLTESDDRHLLWKGIITPTQVQVINDALQWETAEEHTKEREARDITKTIICMIRRAGSMLQEIRTLTASAGFLMPTPTPRKAPLTTRQRQDKAMRSQQRIDQTEGWQSNNTARERREWRSMQSFQNTLIRQDIGSKRGTPSHPPLIRNTQKREKPERQKDIRVFFSQGENTTQDNKGIVSTDKTETQNDEETQDIQQQKVNDSKHNRELEYQLEQSRQSKNSISTHSKDISIDICRQEEQKVTRRQTSDTDNSSESKRTENREIKQNPDNTDDNSSNTKHVRAQYSAQGTHNTSQTNNTQTQNGQVQIMESIRWEEGVRKGEEEIEGQSYKRPITKKVQWWDVH
jgi:hypothetical protein